MTIRDIVDLINKNKRDRERAKVAKYAVGYTAGIVAVAAAGFTIGILFSPKAGKETREDIKTKVVDTVKTIKDKVNNKMEAAKDSIGNAVIDVGNSVKDAHTITKAEK